MNKRLTAVILVLLTVSLSVFVLSRLGGVNMAFFDDFSSGDLAKWSRFFVSSGSSQTVSGGVARFIVPTPTAGERTYSFIVKDGFTSTVNSTITTSQDIYVTKVPSGCQQGNGAIFFFYICDSTDLWGNKGNFGVGIDGSGVWSLWIGGNLTYSYVFQTAGSAPVSNTWYHIVLTVNNSAETVTLAVDGTTVISKGQQEFTDKTHPISLMTGMGEDWWSDGSGQHEVDVANVRLDFSESS